MGLIIENGVWNLIDTINSKEYSKKLKTSGSFVDKDIQITLLNNEGKIDYPDSIRIENPNASFSLKNEDIYTIHIDGNNTFSPNFTPGWVENIEPIQLSINGEIEVPATKMYSGLIESTSKPSGYDKYITRATMGYNEKDLTNNLDVYQGDYDK